MRTVGEILRQTREAKFYTLDEIEKATKIRKELLAFADQTGIEFIDPTDAFREAYKSGTILHYPNDRHFNEVGHKIAAEKISPKIKEILR